MNLFEFLRLQGVDISRYLPKFLYEDNGSIKGVLDVCSWEHEKQRKLLTDIAKQFFVGTATWGLADWERIAEVQPRPGDTYEQRRNRVILKLNGTQTATVDFMERLARRYVSEDSQVQVTEYPEEYRFMLSLKNGQMLYSQDLLEAINIYIPAHLGMTLQIEREIPLSLKFGFGSLVNGQARLGSSTPPDADVHYLTEAVTCSSGRRIVGSGPSELTARLAQLFATVNICAGAGSIPYNPEDIPPGQKEILKDAILTPYMAAKALPVGSRQIPPAMPAEGEQVLFTGMATDVGGRARISTALPDGSWCRSFLGCTQAITGRVTVGADKGDLPLRRRMMAHVGLMQAGLSAVG